MFAFIYTAKLSELTSDSLMLLNTAGGSQLCFENELNLALTTTSSLEYINWYCKYWVKPCAYIIGGIWALSIIIKLLSVLGFAFVPEFVYRCKKKYRGIPNDYSDFRNEFKKK